MMKKWFIILIVLLFICGCEKEKPNMEVKTVKPDIQKEEVVPVYQDENTTPIGIYSLNGNSLNKLTKIQKKFVIEDDIGVFQVYPSNEEFISLTKSFADSYYEQWMNYKKDTNLKVGFQIEFQINHEDVFFTILKPDDCMKRWEHLMTYLYDDYANRGKGFYSHIENNEYQDTTLFTAIKIQSSYQVSEITSPILLTVFTYDTEDDFNEEGKYRGNSFDTIKLCNEGISC